MSLHSIARLKTCMGIGNPKVLGLTELPIIKVPWLNWNCCFHKLSDQIFVLFFNEGPVMSNSIWDLFSAWARNVLINELLDFDVLLL